MPRQKKDRKNTIQILIKSNGQALKKVKKLGRKISLEKIKKSGLKGRGGASFPTYQKWQFVINETSKEKYLICNADEGEPGAFKDKFIIKNNPENLIEGILIAYYITNLNKAFIYLRHEYCYLKNKLEKTIKKFKASNKIQIITGAGAYICGDETALINSIENKRGSPSERPPFPTQQGLFKKPTIINNVETLANVPLIFITNYNPKLRLFSLSGNLTRPGIYELEEGINLKELIKLGKPKNKIKAVYFGAAAGLMPFKSISLTDKILKKYNCFLGSCVIIAIDEKQKILDLALNLAKFFEYESCGKCTPCREGTMRILEILERISLGKKYDLETLKDLIFVMKETSLCGLGKTAPLHLENALKYFKNEIKTK